MSDVKIPNLNTFADLIDRLAIEVNKISTYEGAKRKEQAEESPSDQMIAQWDNLSREANELRSALKNKINEALCEIVRTGSYRTYREPRTFRGSARTVEEVLDEMCMEASEKREELAVAMHIKLNERKEGI